MWIRVQQRARLVKRQNPSIVGQRMNDDDRVGSRLDDFVEVANRAEPRGQGERPVEPQRVAAPNQIPAGEVARRKVVMARNRDQRPSEAPGHMLDEPRLPAAGRALQHHRQATRMAGFEHRDFIANGKVVGRVRTWVPHDGMLVRVLLRQLKTGKAPSLGD